MRAILWLGREPAYIRNDVLIQALKENHVEIELVADTHKNMVIRFLRTFPHYILATRKPHDFVWLGFYGHPLAFFAKWFTRKPIILDAWLSSYETVVHARSKKGNIWEKLIPAGFFSWLDQFVVNQVDLSVFPSNGEKNYYRDNYGVPEKKLGVVWVGVNTQTFTSTKVKPHPKTIVLFSGTFLHITHVETAVRAANELKKNNDIEFWFIGNGQTFEADQQLAQKLGLTNVQFLGRKPYAEIPAFLQQADICLGIFGGGDKANRILPAKMYEAMAMSKPCITARSDGVAELLEDGKSVVFIPPKDHQALAKAILDLANHPDKRKKIGTEAHRVFLRTTTPQKIGEMVLSLVERLKQQKGRRGE